VITLGLAGSSAHLRILNLIWQTVPYMITYSPIPGFGCGHVWQDRYSDYYVDLGVSGN
jgi:hypothetical protein